MIDNIELIREQLVFDSEDDFYSIQIIKRKKENPNLDINSLTKKTFFIKSLESFDKSLEDIKDLCKLYNARAYINLNRKSFDKAGKEMLKRVPEIYLSGDKGIRNMKSLYNRIVGSINGEPRVSKKWMIDIDKEDLENKDNIIKYIVRYKIKHYLTIPTLNGYHIITEPFDLNKHELFASNIDIKKDCLTILYY